MRRIILMLLFLPLSALLLETFFHTSNNHSLLESIYIRKDGSIEPDTAPLNRNRNVYTLLEDVYCNIVIEKDNIVVDGQNFTINGNMEFESKGIILHERQNVTIKNFKISGFYFGIWLNFANNNKLLGNTFTHCTGRNIFLSDSNNNVICCNIMCGNKGRGILLYNSHNNTIAKNKIVEGGCDAIVMHHSNYNLVAHNEITNNNGRGIWLGYSLKNNLLGNEISSNNYDGIRLYYSYNNSISENTVSNNNCNGIALEFSGNNTIVSNNFVNNFNNALTGSSQGNNWNSPYPIGGNYWSHIKLEDNYRGPYQNVSGSDGIVDKEFLIDGYNKDNYPLMGLFSKFNLDNYSSLHIISNWTVTNVCYTSSNSTIKINLFPLEKNATGFCLLRVPHRLIYPPYNIWVNSVPYVYVNVFENETLSVIYFNFNESCVEVLIVQEFQLNDYSILLLTLFSSVTLFKGVYRKKHIS